MRQDDLKIYPKAVWIRVYSNHVTQKLFGLESIPTMSSSISNFNMT